MAPILPQKQIYLLSEIQFIFFCWKDPVHYGIGEAGDTEPCSLRSRISGSDPSTEANIFTV